MDSLVKIGSVLHGLQTVLVPGIIVLQEKGCLLLWPDSGSSNLQLCQLCNVVVRVCDVFISQEIQKNQPFSISIDPHITLFTEGCILIFFFDGDFTCHHSMDCHFDSSS